MRKIKLTLFGLILVGFFSSCMSEKKKPDQNQPIEKINVEKKTDSSDFYRKDFAGGYTIEVKGVSSAQEVEVYALNENGGASWLWVENDGKGGANVEDKKNGTWTATKNSITINIQGNSGMISETYELKNGILTNVQLPKRYLKRTE